MLRCCFCSSSVTRTALRWYVRQVVMACGTVAAEHQASGDPPRGIKNVFEIVAKAEVEISTASSRITPFTPSDPTNRVQ
jgi:hypothetical protein